MLYKNWDATNFLRSCSPDRCIGILYEDTRCIVVCRVSQFEINQNCSTWDNAGWFHGPQGHSSSWLRWQCKKAELELCGRKPRTFTQQTHIYCPCWKGPVHKCIRSCLCPWVGVGDCKRLTVCYFTTASGTGSPYSDLPHYSSAPHRAEETGFLDEKQAQPGAPGSGEMLAYHVR